MWWDFTVSSVSFEGEEKLSFGFTLHIIGFIMLREVVLLEQFLVFYDVSTSKWDLLKSVNLLFSNSCWLSDCSSKINVHLPRYFKSVDSLCNDGSAPAGRPRWKREDYCIKGYESFCLLFTYIDISETLIVKEGKIVWCNCGLEPESCNNGRDY